MSALVRVRGAALQGSPNASDLAARLHFQTVGLPAAEWERYMASTPQLKEMT